MSSQQETPQPQPVRDWKLVRSATRNRDVQAVLILIAGVLVVSLIWNMRGAQELAAIIDALAAATPENRAVALNYLGQALLILLFGSAILRRIIRAINRRRPS